MSLYKGRGYVCYVCSLSPVRKVGVMNEYNKYI